MNVMIIALNLNHKDPTKRAIYQNKDFRIGLSHAINRQEIIDVVYLAQGEPWQAAPRREMPFFNEQLAKQYTEYDVARANEHLDKAGFAERDGDGFRLGPTGEKLTVIVDVVTQQQERIDALELITGYWREVGVELVINAQDRSLMYTRKNANDHDAMVWGGDGGLDAILEPRWYFPFFDESNYAQAWQTWYNNPSGAGALTQPEEPPEPVKRQMDLYDQIKGTIDEARQQALMAEILAIAADQFYVIGTALPGNGYLVAKNNFGNVPESMPDAWLYPNPAPTDPSQYFLRP
jgi:peptide/nickel transport system substrate-binding protein